MQLQKVEINPYLRENKDDKFEVIFVPDFIGLEIFQ